MHHDQTSYLNRPDRTIHYLVSTCGFMHGTAYDSPCTRRRHVGYPEETNCGFRKHFYRTVFDGFADDFRVIKPGGYSGDGRDDADNGVGVSVTGGNFRASESDWISSKCNFRIVK